MKTYSKLYIFIQIYPFNVSIEYSLTSMKGFKRHYR